MHINKDRVHWRQCIKKVRGVSNGEKTLIFCFCLVTSIVGDWMPYPADVKEEMGVEKLELKLPNLRRMMERGTSFTCALSPAPICAPARACLASGLRYKNCRVYSNNVNYDPELLTFYRQLKDWGYYVQALENLI